MRAPPDAFLRDLRQIVPDGTLTDPAAMESYRHDEVAMLDSSVPAAVMLPRAIHEVQAVMRLASERRVPVVPRGAGSGLAGGANASVGAIVLSLERMNRLLELDEAAQTALVEPGLTNGALSRAAREVGLFYPPDPASAEYSTLGGNLATNAGGLCCVKYGVTRDWALALEVVLADGSLIHTGRATIKGVAGYDLTSLFVGSEGTLGIIVKARLRLRPAPPAAQTVIGFFPSLAAAGEAVTAIRRRLVPSILELLDHACVVAVEEWKHLGLDTKARALLLAQSDAGGAQGLEEVAFIEECGQAAGASLVVRSDAPAEAETLMTARRLVFPALQQLGDTLLDDVAVPIPRIPELIEAIGRIAQVHRVRVATFGHAGDGNMHPTIIFDRREPSSVAAARSAFDEIVQTALRLGGTVTGEHGIGLLKRDYLSAEFDPATVALQRTIKDALDPLGIMNPRKVLPLRA